MKENVIFEVAVFYGSHLELLITADLFKLTSRWQVVFYNAQTTGKL